MNRKRYSFEASKVAWDFMRACESAGVLAGFPTLRGPYTVEVLTEDQSKADALYEGFSDSPSG